MRVYPQRTDDPLTTEDTHMSNRPIRTTAAALAAALLLCSCDGGMTEIGRNENVQTAPVTNAPEAAPSGAENPETPAADNGSAPESPAEATANLEANKAFDEYTAQLKRCRAFGSWKKVM